MVQLIMVFGIGFLSAALLALAAAPVVHWRAVRLTTRNLDEAIPASVQELRVEKDQMRAKVAMSVRRLEVMIEHLKGKNVAHQTEIAKKSERVASLQTDCANKEATITALEEDKKRLQDQLAATVNENAAGAALLLVAQRSLAEKE